MCVKKNHKSVSVLMIEGLHYQVHQVQSATYLFTYSFIHSFIHSVSNHLLHRTNWTKTQNLSLFVWIVVNMLIVLLLLLPLLWYIIYYYILSVNKMITQFIECLVEVKYLCMYECMVMWIYFIWWNCNLSVLFVWFNVWICNVCVRTI